MNLIDDPDTYIPADPIYGLQRNDYENCKMLEDKQHINSPKYSSLIYQKSIYPKIYDLIKINKENHPIKLRFSIAVSAY